MGKPAAIPPGPVFGDVFPCPRCGRAMTARRFNRFTRTSAPACPACVPGLPKPAVRPPGPSPALLRLGAKLAAQERSDPPPVPPPARVVRIATPAPPVCLPGQTSLLRAKLLARRRAERGEDEPAPD